MEKVLLFARDPGGANTLIPLYSKLKKEYEVVVYGKDVAIGWFANEKIPCKDIMSECKEISLEEIEKFVKKHKFDMVITGTSLDDYTERYLWKVSTNFSVKSYAIMDQWMNMGIRFSKYNYKECDKYEDDKNHEFLPYKIFVMDMLAKNMLISDGIEEEKIVVSGQPHFEVISQDYESKDALYNDEKVNILFVSEPISQDYDDGLDNREYWGFNEKSMFRSLIKALKNIVEKTDKRFRVIVKPHPRENVENWNDFKEEFSSREIEVLIDTSNNKYSILQSVKVVCGMSSMLLLEAIICKKAVISMMMGLKRENPFVLDRLGMCKSCKRQEEFEKKLKIGVLDTLDSIDFEYIDNASDNIIRSIKEDVNK